MRHPHAAVGHLDRSAPDAHPGFPGGLACEDASQASAKDCWGFVVGNQTRMAVIDVGAAPVFMWMRGNPDNPEWAAAADQFDQMLTTVEFLKPLPAARQADRKRCPDEPRNALGCGK